MDMDTLPPEALADDLHMELNSMVEVTLGSGNAYGIIRWIGSLPDRNDLMVGLELVNLYSDMFVCRIKTSDCYWLSSFMCLLNLCSVFEVNIYV